VSPDDDTEALILALGAAIALHNQWIDVNRARMRTVRDSERRSRGTLVAVGSEEWERSERAKRVGG
jgi:hypothetical protein